MTTRATVAAGNDNPINRRHHKAVSIDVACFEILDANCLLEILKFIDTEDLNSFAICSQRCREARSDPSLDQTRTGTIVCTPNTSILRTYNPLWNNIFSGNRKSLTVVDLDRVPNLFLTCNGKLTGVTSLHLSSSHHDIGRCITYRSCEALAFILPNLQEADFSYLQTGYTVANPFCRLCPSLSQFTWKCATLYLNGGDFKNSVSLSNLYLDGCRFNHPSWEGEHDYEEEPTNGRRSYYMLMCCKHLEHLSIKNSTWFQTGHKEQLVSQGMIIKFVRHTPTLRWLRSDLTEDNVAMLLQERPDITFVTE